MPSIIFKDENMADNYLLCSAAFSPRFLRKSISLPLLLVILLTWTCFASAQQTPTPDPQYSEANLVQREYDPTASLTQVQAKEIYTPAQYGADAQLNTLQIRSILAVSPLSLLPLEQLIRPTLRLVTVARGKGTATATGFDDMQLLDLFVMPWPNSEETAFRWGFGPYFVFPTSTTNFSGQGSWQAGPAFGFAYRGIPGLNLSGLFQQATSFAYTSPQSNSVTLVSFQPLLSYQLGRGWYLKSSDATWTFNLRHNTSTTIPISAGFGKVWKLSSGYAFDTSISGEWMAYRQFAARTEQTSVIFQLSALLPKIKG